MFSWACAMWHMTSGGMPAAVGVAASASRTAAVCGTAVLEQWAAVSRGSASALE
ncbi:hypothetical protein [Streptomyces sp. SHP 1-2]|uniref:hypothetical protein n=1 Tax=Streptomyces sp. SHP 1-2 TaxID=2769489 RepID=UPI002237CE2F|nr:hypothetical protein [Streptomyces sp. SHP 1-2]